MKKRIHHLAVLLSIAIIVGAVDGRSGIVRRRALQPEHEKPQIDKWMEAFVGRGPSFDQVPSLVKLITLISTQYLAGCTPIILYDVVVESGEGLLLEQLMRVYPIAYKHGQVSTKYKVRSPKMLENFGNTCVSYILFVADVMKCPDVIGPQTENRVVIVARSSQWRVYEFLNSDLSRVFVNLLVVAQSEKITPLGEEVPFILYTHRMYIDGIGSSEPWVLTSWIRGKFTRPMLDLFPRKMVEGFSGHRFIVALANQPPYVVKRGQDVNDESQWDGIEVRLIQLMSTMYNFTIDFREAAKIEKLGSGDAVTEEVRSRRANIGIAGIYVTADRIAKIDITQNFDTDCAAFMTLTSTALPRYRAIMGPFHWTVWMCITLTYLLGIFPISFSDRHTLRHLLEKPEEIENMFWYVFARFTNAFSMSGVDSWDKSDKVTTRVLVGFYWMFTIITTACYTGSIIAFVTLPVFPSTIDSIKQLLSGWYQIGILDKGGWQYWFANSSDPDTVSVLRRAEYIPNVLAGIRNTTKAFFWPYSFLGSRGELDYIIRKNFSTMSKRTMLHISDECFVPYGISMIFTMNSVYRPVFNMGLMQIWQSGFVMKFKHDVEWEMMRSASGKLLQASSGNSLKSLSYEDRALTLDDTQGMFLLLGLGFAMGGCSLLSEWLGGCLNLCKRGRAKSSSGGRGGGRNDSMTSDVTIVSDADGGSNNNDYWSGDTTKRSSESSLWRLWRGRGGSNESSGCWKRRRGSGRDGSASSSSSIESNPRSHDDITPREKINSIQYAQAEEGSTLMASISEERNVTLVNGGRSFQRDWNEEDEIDIEREISRIFDLDRYLGSENEDMPEESDVVAQLEVRSIEDVIDE